MPKQKHEVVKKGPPKTYLERGIPMNITPTTRGKQEKFVAAYFKNLGHIGKACETAEVGRATYYDWLERDPNFKKMLDDKIEHINDNVAAIIIAKAHKGDNDMIKFWAKTQMKHRGFTERTEQVNLNIDITRQVMDSWNEPEDND